jgi:hypothetical protein
MLSASSLWLPSWNPTQNIDNCSILISTQYGLILYVCEFYVSKMTLYLFYIFILLFDVINVLAKGRQPLQWTLVCVAPYTSNQQHMATFSNLVTKLVTFSW